LMLFILKNYVWDFGVLNWWFNSTSTKNILIGYIECVALNCFYPKKHINKDYVVFYKIK
jgi:hypothetical protein